jgi:anti-sigma factor RsiW
VFEERLPAWLEGQLDDAERAVMEQHHESCDACATLVADLDGIVESARSLPVLTPSRDLWSGIEARLAAPVIPLASRRDSVVARQPARRTGVSVRWLAVAATVLMAVSSAVTWTVARARFSVPVSMSASAGAPVLSGGAAIPSVASATAPATSASRPGESPSSEPPSSTSLSTSPAAPVARGGQLASARRSSELGQRGSVSPRATQVGNAGSMSDVDAIYEKEIAALRRIVDQRFTELDSGTVAALRQNLQTIDQAIEDSRRALKRDPRSGLLSTELDRTLEAKLALMRRVALL